MEPANLGILLAIAISSIMLSIFILIRTKQQLTKTKVALSEIANKYSGIDDVNEYKERVRREADEYLINTTKNSDSIAAQKELELAEASRQIDELREVYVLKRRYLEDLLNEIALYENQTEILSYGVYEPHFEFDVSEQYKEQISSIREQQKGLIRDGKAVNCYAAWTVNGSSTEGKRQTKQYSRLMLRAFNGECDALIADVRWNNATKMEVMLRKAHDAINKLGETHMISISYDYYSLKLSELRLTHEYKEKRHTEREEQRRLRYEEREEDRARKEYEIAIKESQEEEERYSRAVEQARKEISQLHGEEMRKAQERLFLLENELAKAIEKRERALSMAQQTKAGHVYVISNIGAFGENVFKIGMTRRLEPMERVKELSDASVPFGFDVHAMIYSENAPELEASLHKELEQRRVNLVNGRKEFFNVSIQEIEQIVKRKRSDIVFIRLAEARDYRESLAIVKNSENPPETAAKHTLLDKFPESI